MSSRKLWIAVGVVVLVAGWWAFRPERLFIQTRVDEGFPTAVAAQQGGPVVLAEGRFHSVAHETQGTATVYRLPDGTRVLRFKDFETSNGPEVQVYLVAARDATDNDTVKKAGFVTLGPIKGSVGDQNYELPADLDLATYRAVTIWCRRFGVNFGTAPLALQQG